MMAMAGSGARAAANAPMRLLYSSRSLDEVIYREELEYWLGNGFEVVHTLTREQPPGWSGYARRIDAELLAEVAWPAADEPKRLRLRLDPLRRRGRGRARRARLRPGCDPDRALRGDRVMETSDLRLDGNAIGGLLNELFGVELTAAPCVCGSCGAREEMARLDVYVRCARRCRPLPSLRPT